MTRPEVIVLGAGIVGVSTALALQSRGHAVTLVDRKQPGRETSYGNAGIIQREAVEPYRFPRDLFTLLGVAFRRRNDVSYHAGALWGLLPPLARYWFSSAPKRYVQIVMDYSTLIAHCVDEHRPLVEDAGANDLVRHDGWHQAYRSATAFAQAANAAQAVAARHGLRCKVLDGDALAAEEPALLRPLAGAIHWQDPWTVRDPGALVRRYADLFVRRGGVIACGDAMTLRQSSSGWSAETTAGAVSAPHAVVALGPWADALTRNLGYRLPLFIKRGYHRHYSALPSLKIPLLDTANGIMLAPMSSGLRLSTGAEFARLDAAATPVQIFQSERYTRELLELGDPIENAPWLGARPCTPDMKPVVGPGFLHKGLWFNFGHAHQGLTLGPATGRLLAEQIGGERTYIDATPFLPVRFAA